MDGNQPISSPAATTSRMRKRRPAGTPKENAVVVALTPEELLESQQFTCTVCKKGYKRRQNLVVHMRSHNKEAKLMKRDPQDVPARQKVYVCPVAGCVHNDPRRALSDITGVKKHYSRKHVQKQFTCGVCSRSYALYGDLKAHAKTCTSAFSCSCGAFFAKHEELMTHKSSCDVYNEEAMPESSTDNSDASPPSSRFGSNTSIETIEKELPSNMFSSLSNASGKYHESALPKTLFTTFGHMDNSGSFSENTMSYPTTLNTSSNALIEIQMHASSNNFPPRHNTSHASSSNISNFVYNNYEKYCESRRHVLSSDAGTLSIKPRSSLTIVDEYSIYCPKLQQSEAGDIYKASDMIDILSLSKDHPMLKYPIPASINPSRSDILSSTYNSHQSYNTNSFKN